MRCKRCYMPFLFARSSLIKYSMPALIAAISAWPRALRGVRIGGSARIRAGRRRQQKYAVTEAATLAQSLKRLGRFTYRDSGLVSQSNAKQMPRAPAIVMNLVNAIPSGTRLAAGVESVCALRSPAIDHRPPEHQQGGALRGRHLCPAGEPEASGDVTNDGGTRQA